MIVNCSVFLEQINKAGECAIPLYESNGFWDLRKAYFCRFFKIEKGYNINELIKTDDNEIIVFDGGIKEQRILEIIRDQNKDKRLIFYYWNPVEKSILLKRIPNEYEIWTYSLSDSEKYGLKYNSTFYFPPLISSQNTMYNDIIFIGRDKGRYSILKKWEKFFLQMGVDADFQIMATHEKLADFNFKKFSPYIPYEEILDRCLKAKCIFDYYVDEKSGLSLRTMEALFLKKKLITNNILIKRYNFYNDNNIFILGQDDISDIYNFVNSPYINVKDDILDEYTFGSWRRRFN